MDTFLVNTVIFLALVVVFGYLNEKVTRFTHEIALMLFAVILGGALAVFGAVSKGTGALSQILEEVQFFNLEGLLILLV